MERLVCKELPLDDNIRKECGTEVEAGCALTLAHVSALLSPSIVGIYRHLEISIG